ncbi:MAG: polysaccharide deacetylase family protein [Candidatus Tectomicrobia bacterium]|nr:polysaccharide deacetylase family protein [Candidatus Tectomicrobia bacterium]
MKKMRILSLFWHSVESDVIPLDYLDGSNPTTSMFREQVKFVLSHYNSVSIIEFLELLRNPDAGHSTHKAPVLLGFDDGFKNVMTNALPILNEFNIPAVFFVTGEILRNPDFVPWFVEVKHLMRWAMHQTIVYRDTKFHLVSPQDCTKLQALLNLSIQACRSETERQRLLTYCANLLGVDRPAAPDLDDDLRFVSKEDLAELGSSSLLTVASHAMTHRHLGSLTYEEQLHELEQSDTLLRQHCPSYYPIVAYPSGSFNTDTISIATHTYAAGFATFLGASYRNPYAYPRIGVNQDTVQELAYAVSPQRLNYLLPLKRALHSSGILRGR